MRFPRIRFTIENSDERIFRPKSAGPSYKNEEPAEESLCGLSSPSTQRSKSPLRGSRAPRLCALRAVRLRKKPIAERDGPTGSIRSLARALSRIVPRSAGEVSHDHGNTQCKTLENTPTASGGFGPTDTVGVAGDGKPGSRNRIGVVVHTAGSSLSRGPGSARRDRRTAGSQVRTTIRSPRRGGGKVQPE